VSVSRVGVARRDLPLPRKRETSIGYGPDAPRLEAQRSSGSRSARLCATAFVFERDASPSQRVAIVVVDLWGPSLALLRRARRALDAKAPELAGLPIVLLATHTHSGPGRYLGVPFYDAFAQRFRPFRRTLEGYADSVGSTIAAAVHDAWGARQAAELGFGRRELWGVAANRSLGAYRANFPEERRQSADEPGCDGAEDGGPVPRLVGFPTPPGEVADARWQAVDPRVSAVAAFRPGEPSPFAVLAFFGCHATALGLTTEVFSPDWPGVAAEVAERALCGAPGDVPGESEPRADAGAGVGPGPTVAIAITGAGDCSPLPPSALGDPRAHPASTSGDGGKRAPRGAAEAAQGSELAWSVGKRVGEAVAAAVGGMTRKTSGFEVDAREGRWTPPTRAWYVGFPKLGGADDRRGIFWRRWPFREGATKRGPCAPAAQRPKVCVPRLLTRWFPLSPEHPLHLVRLGEALTLATLPGEPTTLAAWRVEEALGGSRSEVVVAGYGGDYAGYLTTPEEYDAQHYEGASTLYGRETLPSLLQALNDIVNPVEVSDLPGAPARSLRRLPDGTEDSRSTSDPGRGPRIGTDT